MAYTQQSTLDFSKAAYDRIAYFALRPELYFDQAADIMPTAQSMPGSSVQFTVVNDLPAASSTISETSDISPVAMSDSVVSVALAEYGNAVITTAKLRGTSFLEIDPVVANVIGYNAGLSIDTLARNTLRDFVMDNGVNYYNNSAPTGGTAGTLSYNAATDVFTGAGAKATASDFAKQRAILRASNVATFGGFYVSYVHPDVVYDVQQDTGAAGWRLPHVYSQPGEIWSGEMGAIEGVRFIETPRAAVFPDTTVTLRMAYVTGGAAGASTFTVTSGLGDITTGVSIAGVGIGNGVTATYVSSTGVLTLSSPLTVQAVGAYAVDVPPNVANTQIASGLTTGNPAGDVYQTLVLGRQGLAKVHSVVDGNGPVPHIIPGPITDTLRRYVPMGWYWLGGYSGFRKASVRGILSVSSLNYTDPTIAPADQ